MAVLYCWRNLYYATILTRPYARKRAPEFWPYGLQLIYKFSHRIPQTDKLTPEMNNPEATLDPELASEAQVHAGSAGETSVPDAQTEDLAQQLADSQEKLAYLAAELENYKRQTARRLSEESDRTARRTFENLLPALDTFGMAMQYADKATNVADLKTGLDFVAQQMATALEGAGIEAIPAVGAAFDPKLHEAIEEIDSDLASGVVAEEAKRGYTYKGNVLRPAIVKVAK